MPGLRTVAPRRRTHLPLVRTDQTLARTMTGIDGQQAWRHVANDRDQPLHPQPDRLRDAATLTVCRHATNPADARQLLTALGLL